MVNSSKSGDLFSINPITGNKDQIVIQGRWGLSLKSSPGASIFICDKHSAQIIESYESKPTKYYTKDPQHGNTAVRTLEEEFKNIPVLGSREIELLTKIAKDVENKLGFPVNLEWAIEKRKFHLIQVRPAANFFKRPVFSNQFTNQFDKTMARGLPASPGFVTNKTVIINSPNDFHKFQPNNILITDSFNGQILPLMLQSSGVIFKNEDLSSFGSVIARDFEKPCMVKAKLEINYDLEQAELNASTGKLYGPEQISKNEQEFEEQTETINLEGIYKKLESVEHEITTLNAKLTEARSQNLLSDEDQEKSKLISELEWDVRELKDKLSQYLR